MPRRRVQKERTPEQRVAFLKKQLVAWNSQIRVDHEKVAEIQERIIHAEGMRDEIQRQIKELTK